MLVPQDFRKSHPFLVCGHLQSHLRMSEEKAQFITWGVFRCARPTYATARPWPLASALGVGTHINASFPKG